MIGLELLEYDKDKTCCFTGHRSSKLPGEGDREFPGMKRLESNIEMELQSLITKKGVRYFITGMASGIDLICAECVLRLKAAVNNDIELICAVPYVGQIAEMKTLQEKYLYTMIEHKSAKAVTLADGYYKDCYKARNIFMVDNSSFMLAVYKPSLKGSGTLQTINYAKKCGLDIKMIDLDKNPQFYS
ncbi:MAG: DUF1273 family protein [Ruminococcus sp.]|nr:DUF1273 family protein [Ruminococcus sp.]